MKGFVYLIVFLSGFTGLVYQITWQKYLSIYLGSHSLSAVLTLSCFFLFLSLGYSLLGKKGHLLGRNRLMTYGYIEAFIGLFAILSPKLFLYLYRVWPHYPSDSFAHIFSSFGFAFILMAFPTFLMGGTIPILTQALSAQWKESHKVHAWVYGINTLGAFIGSLVSGFYLLEVLGLEQSLNLTGILNCLLFLAVLITCSFSKLDFSGATPQAKKSLPLTFLIKNYGHLLSLSFISGFISFGIESLSIRIAGLSLGSSNYTYSIVVSAFILSIALGSLLASKAKDFMDDRWLLRTHIGIFISFVALYFILPHWPDIFMRIRISIASSAINFNIYWFCISLGIFLTLLIPVSLLGTTLPLLFQRLRSEDQHLNETAGRIYAINSLGAALGAILAGYLFFYWMNLSQVFISLLIATLLALFILVQKQTTKKTYNTLLLLSLILCFTLPQWRESHFIPSRFTLRTPPPTQDLLQKTYDALNLKDKEYPKIIYSDFGVNTYTAVTEEESKNRSIYVNAKPDATTDGDNVTRTLTSLLPLTLAQQPKSVFIVGLGAGLSTGVSASFEEVERVKVCEIAKGSIEALPYFSKWNFKLEENKDKVQIVNDDAYKVLRNETSKYDLIYSEPSNTWVTGVEKLYTQEFLKVAASKLTPHGIYSQWFPLFSIEEQSFLTVLKNFKASFPHVTLWSAGGAATLILASHQPISIDLKNIREKSQKYTDIYSSVGLDKAENILYLQIWSDSVIHDLVKQSLTTHSIFHPTLAFQSSRAYFSNTIIHPESIADKYFILLDKNYKDEPLIWQNSASELDKSFFEKGIQFFAKTPSLAFAAGRLTLEKEKLFGPNKDLKKEKKYKQYFYLQADKKESLPKKLSEEKDSDLFTELYRKYIYLKKMRAPAKLSNLLQAAPNKCTEKNCYSSKLGLLLYDKSITPEQAILMSRDVSKTSTQETIEELFTDFVKKYN